MDLHVRLAIAALAAGSCLAPAGATSNYDYVYTNAAQACQLSIPTIDTQVSPRANGFRNDGSSTTWVICGLWNPVETDTYYLDASIYLSTADGAAHDVNCTGVNGDGSGTQQYVSKTIHVAAGSPNATVFSAVDFGGSTSIPNGYNFSITCALPPHAAIERVSAHVFRNIGA